ncbi:MAG: hypothetical protein CL946_06650 [Ectothiorhodospiraceae bacterium]|nr:hypothetical protein [Ectothiorhodospiraceae bacterium]
MAKRKISRSKQKSQLKLLSDHAIGEFEDHRSDGLNFEKYANVFSNVLVGTEGPFVIGVYGDWGSGKTSLMRLIKKNVSERQESDSITVWFNAWQYEREKHPIIPLIATIIKSIDQHICNNSISERVRTSGKKIMSALSAIAYGFSAGIEVGGHLGGPKGALQFSAKDVIDRSEDLKKDPLLEKSLYYNAFERLNKVNTSELRIVLFIDDLDRCLPDKAIALLESMKLVLAQQGFLFVLGINRAVIEGYLKYKFQEEYAISDLDGAAYLDKMVQLGFSIPSHLGKMPDLSKALMNESNNIGPSEADDIANIIELVSDDNPRKVVRFINNILIDKEICSELGQKYDLYVYTITRALELGWNTFYKNIVRNDSICDKLCTLNNSVKGVPDTTQLTTLQDENPESSSYYSKLIEDVKLRKLLFSVPGIKWLNETGTRKEAISFMVKHGPKSSTDNIMIDNLFIICIDAHLTELYARVERRLARMQDEAFAFNSIDILNYDSLANFNFNGPANQPEHNFFIISIADHTTIKKAINAYQNLPAGRLNTLFICGDESSYEEVHSNRLRAIRIDLSRYIETDDNKELMIVIRNLSRRIASRTAKMLSEYRTFK